MINNIIIYFQQEPEEIILSQRAEYRNVRGRQKFKLVKETFHYIPVVKTLQALLSHPDILLEVSECVLNYPVFLFFVVVTLYQAYSIQRVSPLLYVSFIMYYAQKL